MRSQRRRNIILLVFACLGPKQPCESLLREKPGRSRRSYFPNVVEGKQDFPLRMHPIKIRKNSLFKKCPTYVYSCFPASGIPVGTGKRHVYMWSR